MALYIAKPILWNPNGYLRPSGVLSHSGFPAEHGFGYEEWNGAPGMSFTEDGVAHRIFHTEGVGNARVEDEKGNTVVFMYASHDKMQQLVGIAASATCLIGDEPQRKSLAEKLCLGQLGDDAWALPRVRALHDNNRARFSTLWRSDFTWIPAWRCPSDTFLWLPKPATLDAKVIRGKSKLLTMFGRYTELDKREALTMLSFIPVQERTNVWTRIVAEIEAPDPSSLFDDLSELHDRRNLSKTTRKQLVDARLGQGTFRKKVEHLWGGACAISGCTLAAALRASHIKAWSRSDDEERLDCENGLLLTADLDALFDRGLISFDENGQMLVSSLVGRTDRELFQLPRAMRTPPSRSQQRYLATHRRRWAYPA